MKVAVIIDGHPEISCFSALIKAAAGIDPDAKLAPGPHRIDLEEGDSYVLVNAGTVPASGAKSPEGQRDE